MSKKFILLFCATMLLSGCGQAEVHAAPKQSVVTETTSYRKKTAQTDNSSKKQESGSLMYQYSTTLETEKPELDEITKQLVSSYQKNPTQENYDNLRAQVEINYEKVLDKKKAKLQELKETAKEQSKITEMEDIVTEMIEDRENRINQTMLRLTDSRLRPGTDTEEGYVPVMGAGENVYISVTPVTNQQYSLFLQATGHSAPENWENGSYPAGQKDYPVTFVSWQDAADYCEWMTGDSTGILYRLPTEEEWELAAGHMPKDAAMNTGNTSGVTSVYTYAETTAASGAIDMWGNVWEWTSTPRDTDGNMAVKGGAWDCAKTDCRTEYREAGKNALSGYQNVGFRIICVTPTEEQN